MTMLQTLLRLWAGRSLTAAQPARPGRVDDSEQENAQKSFPATGAHWLDGWVIFGNIYM
jgi:hypothetical protein